MFYAQSTITVISGRKNRKVNMPIGRQVRIMADSGILSLYVTHLSMYNCMYHVTPRVLS